MTYTRALTLSSTATGLMVVILAILASAQTPAKKAVPLIVGKWKLNPEKSNLPPFPPNMFELREYRLRADGYLVGLSITSNAGGYHYLQFTAKSDGKDYPEYADPILAEMIATGRQTPRTYAETVIDDYTTEWVDKANGKVISHGKKIISKNGKTLTITVEESSQTLVYDRQ